MVWRIEKGEKIEWNGMRRMVFPNGGYTHYILIKTDIPL